MLHLAECEAKALAEMKILQLLQSTGREDFFSQS